MLIACEKCSTQYVLDDNLIPAQGAPVQCTQCGHVFTARRPEPAPLSGRQGVGEQTMLDTSRSPAAAGSSTMMFGVPGAPSIPAAPPPNKPAAAPNSTMMFGVPGANAAPAPAPKAPAASSTMMFGVPGAPAIPPAAPQQPAARPAAATAMFGVPSVAPSVAPANSTMMFGAPGAAAAPAAPQPANTTMMFGAQGAKAPAAAPQAKPAAAPNSTMMFGAVAPPAGAPKPAATAMFGAPQVAAPAAAPNSTMMFGAVAAPEAPAAKPASPNATMMFGAASVAPAPAAQPARAPAKTAMFGSGGLPKISAGTVELSGQAAPERNESTQRVDLESVMAEQDQAMADSSVHGPASRDRTSAFAMSPLQEETNPAAHMPQAPNSVVVDESASEATLPPSSMSPFGGVPRQTVMFAGNSRPTIEPQPPSPFQPTPAQAPSDPFNTTEPAPAVGGVDLPPEPLFAQPTVPNEALNEPLPQIPTSSGPKIVLAILGLLVLGGLAFVGWKVLGPRLMGESIPVAAESAVAAQLETLRFDNSASKKAAIAELEKTTQTYPTYVDGHAALAMALAVDFDDLQQRVMRLQAKYNALTTKLEAAKKDTGENAKREVEALTTQINEISRQHKELIPGATAAQARLQVAANSLQAVSAKVESGSPSEFAVLRARAFIKAVSGDIESLALAERAAKLSPTPDLWVQLVQPEYAANQSSASRDDALKQLKAILDGPNGSTMIRALVLDARLEIQAGNWEAANESLGKATSASKGHDVAAELSEWAKKESAAQ